MQKENYLRTKSQWFVSTFVIQKKKNKKKKNYLFGKFSEEKTVKTQQFLNLGWQRPFSKFCMALTMNVEH